MRTSFVGARCTAAVLLTMISACRDVGPGLPVTISAQRANTFSTPINVKASNNTIVVTGGYGTGVCQDIVANADFNGAILDIRISSRQKKNLGNVNCPDVLLAYTYEAVVSGLSSGPVHVRVEHSGDAFGPNGTVADETVVLE